jgi:hypothetical protein
MVVFKHELLHILHKNRCFINLINLSHFGYLSKESLNSDGQQFQQYQKMNNHLSTEIIEHKQKPRYMAEYMYIILIH